MLKRDAPYGLFSRELQALDELFSREPEAWAEWAGFAREPKRMSPAEMDKLTTDGKAGLSPVRQSTKGPSPLGPGKR